MQRGVQRVEAELDSWVRGAEAGVGILGVPRPVGPQLQTGFCLGCVSGLFLRLCLGLFRACLGCMFVSWSLDDGLVRAAHCLALHPCSTVSKGVRHERLQAR